MTEDGVYNRKGEIIGFVGKDNKIIYLPSSNPSSLTSVDKPKKKVGRDKGLTELLGGSFSK